VIIPIVCFVGGLVAMGRTKPQTGVRKLLCLGPRSGMVYSVEDFPEIGTVVVRPPTKTAVVQFIRASVREPGKPGLLYQNASGDPRLIELIRRDFGIEPKKLAAVPAAEQPMGAAAAALTESQRALYWSTLVYRAPETLSIDQKRIVDAMKNEPHPQAAAREAAAAAPKPPEPKAQKTGRSTP
jgi:hypothetical protein